jgi:hypothetical protein
VPLVGVQQWTGGSSRGTCHRSTSPLLPSGYDTPMLLGEGYIGFCMMGGVPLLPSKVVPGWWARDCKGG